MKRIAGIRSLLSRSYVYLKKSPPQMAEGNVGLRFKTMNGCPKAEDPILSFATDFLCNLG